MCLCCHEEIPLNHLSVWRAPLLDLLSLLKPQLLRVVSFRLHCTQVFHFASVGSVGEGFKAECAWIIVLT